MIYNLKLFLLLILYQFIDDLVAWVFSIYIYIYIVYTYIMYIYTEKNALHTFIKDNFNMFI